MKINCASWQQCKSVKAISDSMVMVAVAIKEKLRPTEVSVHRLDRAK